MRPSAGRGPMRRPVPTPCSSTRRPGISASSPHSPRPVILAAGFEAQLMPLIQDRPKTMLEVKGRTILDRQVTALHACGVQDITVVRGYQKDRVAAASVRFVDNDRFRETGELYSLLRAREALGGPFLFLYGDIIFEPAILARLLASP